MKDEKLTLLYQKRIGVFSKNRSGFLSKIVHFILFILSTIYILKKSVTYHIKRLDLLPSHNSILIFIDIIVMYTFLVN